MTNWYNFLLVSIFIYILCERIILLSFSNKKQQMELKEHNW